MTDKPTGDPITDAIAARRFGRCAICGSENGHDYALGGVFCPNPNCTANTKAQPDADVVERVARSIQHYLDHKLEGFSNGAHYPPSNPANKTNGYLAAKVPDWQLRQWLSAISAMQPNREVAAMREALEALLAEFEKFSRYGSPIAMQANEAVQKARAALSPKEPGQ